MNAKSLITFFVCLNVAGYIIASLINLDVLTANQEVMPYTATQIANQFNLFTFSATNVAYGLLGAGIAGLIGLITKQGYFAVSAAVIWMLGVFLNIGTWLTSGFSVMMGILLPPELSFMSYVISTFVTFIFFWFLAGTLTQRPDIG